ncbi:neuroglobin-like [Saccoglossus kowalevskii]|uniref:Non-symbiotic hemoglobin 2-like n=1 Tax=Saccoglossus kowalevskii TaxID=10224 RepID=A0ABM0GX16_SACKO|nr:PREDICTED: non-symbiotic hemoglobin 2-like [Saccoglossus kowalevskii]
MGNEVAKSSRSSTSQSLSKEQEKILVQTWLSIRGDLERIGLLMFTGLFEHHPEAKVMFGLSDTAMSPKDKENTALIKEHGLRFMNVVRDVLTLISEKNGSQAECVLIDLGRRHCSYNADINLIDVFGQQFIASIQPTLTGSWDKKVEDAWIQLFKYIAFTMKQGLAAELIDKSLKLNGKP